MLCFDAHPPSFSDDASTFVDYIRELINEQRRLPSIQAAPDVERRFRCAQVGRAAVVVLDNKLAEIRRESGLYPHI